MKQVLIFGLLSIPSVYYSWRAIFSMKNHGFYRFFSWECIIWLFAVNYPYWFVDPFSATQIFSWIFLFLGAYLAVTGAVIMLKHGKASDKRDDKTLFSFEKTTGLIETGVFKYIRHPLYGSLIYLTWGIFLKNPSPVNCIFAVASTAFLYLTSIFDEKECVKYFGEDYKSYMTRSKMFVPFIF
jgi:protein-S-isoprenylcysteine O-methyltransferase Ste14